jgi:serine/threonine protein kinase
MSAETSRLHADAPSALPAGTRLGEFELRGLLGVGGFGIVYLAFDHALEREVAVKEYMPASLAGRTQSMHVSLRSQADAESFALGLRSFVNEARLLARFDHPSLLKVLRFWEANGTAYMAMPVMRGRTIKEVRAALTAPPDERWLRTVLDPLLGAVEKLHSEGVYHRDIAPDNVQIEPDGHPVLLDFGAARRVISDKSQTLTAILKPSYAPIEQYAEAGAVKQGPWTDLYALGATLHFLLLGRPPAPATTRAIHDEASALTPEACPGCSDDFLLMVDWMLSPRPIDRPQSVAALREVLDGRQRPPLRRLGDAAPMSQRQGGVGERTVRVPQASAPAPDVDLQALAAEPMPPATPPRAAALPREPLPLPQFGAPPVSGSLDAPARTPRAQPARGPLWLGAGAGVALLAVAAAVFWPRAAVVAPSGAAASAPALAEIGGSPVSAPPVAESAVATVVVPDAAPRSTAPRPTASSPVARAALATEKPAPEPAPAVVTPPPEPRPVAAPVQAAVAAAVEPPRPAPAPAPAGPDALCAGSNPVMLLVCMERECLRSKFSGHPDCLKWHKGAQHE